MDVECYEDPAWVDTGVEPDRSPELLRLKADALVDYVAGYERHLPHLRWQVRVAEHRYARKVCRESWWFLQKMVGELVACEVAMEHIGHVADEIAAGVEYEREPPREFEEAVRAKIAEIVARIEDSKPKQLTLGW